jgi:hypothetical protein
MMLPRRSPPTGWGDLLLLIYGRLQPGDADRFLATGNGELLTSSLAATAL